MLLTRAAASLALITGSSACLAPPVMRPAYVIDLPRALEHFPAGTRAVELVTADGALLRGVFTPAGHDAPLVLHLLGAAQSPASLAAPLDPAAWRLAEAGYASLMVDYRGVGASPGERDAAWLGDDAWAMWLEAVRLAGSPSRVAIRATSLGTIAAAQLLARGAEPSAILLVAPVFPDTVTPSTVHDVVAQFVGEPLGRLAGALVSALFRPVNDVPVIERLRASGAPLHVIHCERRGWAPRRQIDALVAAQSGRFIVRYTVSADHSGAVVAAIEPTPSELQVLARSPALQPWRGRDAAQARRELAPEVRDTLDTSPAARERFDELARELRSTPARVLAAAALGSHSSDAATLMIIALHDAPPLDDWSQLRARYATWPDDWCLAELVLIIRAQGARSIERGAVRDRSGWDRTLSIARNVRELDCGNPWMSRRIQTRDRTASPLVRFGLSETRAGIADEQFRICVARAALKAAAVPERLVLNRAGQWELQCLEGDAWRTLDLTPTRQRR